MDSTVQMTWVDCFAGPADGEKIPIYEDDPMPSFPYLTLDGNTYTYHLYEDGKGNFRYVLVGAHVEPPWLFFIRPEPYDD